MTSLLNAETHERATALCRRCSSVGQRRRTIASLLLLGAAALFPKSSPSADFLGSDVVSVLTPGQGQDILTATERLPASFTSQLEMFRELPNNLDTLTAANLARFYKPMDLDALAPEEIETTEAPAPGVMIVRDKTYHVPRIYGKTRSAAMFGVGYAQAEDRLWQMEVNRHAWHSATAQLLGPGPRGENITANADLFRTLDYSAEEYRQMYNHLRTNYGYWGRQAYDDIRAYVAGINAYIDAAARPGSVLLPIEFRQRGLAPAHWSPTDVIASGAFAHVYSL